MSNDVPNTGQHRPLRVLAVLTLLFSMLASIALPTPALATDAPTITTSKDDYAPAELVDLSGAGWQAGESIEIAVDDDEGKSWTHRATVAADADGAFAYDFRLPSWFVATYTVVAVGELSGTATTTFTDDIARGGVSFNSNGEGTGPSSELTINVPAVAPGDLLIAQITVAKDLNATDVICTPAGWTSLVRTGHSASGQSKFVQQIFYRVAPASQESFSYHWQFRSQSASCGTNSNRLSKGASGGVIRYTGVHPTNPIEAFAPGGVGSGSATTGAAPAVTTTTANTMVVRFFGIFKNTNINPSTAARVYSVSSSNNSAERAAAAFDAPQAAAGSTGTFNATFQSAEWLAHTVALRMAPPADTTPPVVTAINRANPSPTSAASVSFNVMFSESVTGVDATDFQLATTGVSGASLTSVSGSGGSYTVAVNTGSGNGTIGLNLVDNDSIADATGNRLGGAGNGNGNFTGQVYTIDKIVATELTVAAAGGTYGGSATLSAALTANGAGVGGKTISFSVDGVGVGSATTNASGVASLLVARPAGSYAIEASFAGDSAYGPSTGSNTLTVAKANASISVDGYTGVYDGDAHGATGSATGVNGEDLSDLLDLGDSFTNAPGGMANWSFAGNTNYNPASGAVNISITKADATITVDGYAGVYDGDPHGATGSATGVNGENLSALLDLGASFTDAPGGFADWSFAGNTNYNPASGAVLIAIVPANATIDVVGFSGPYDGDPHGATGSATGVKGEDLSDLLDLGASFINVPGGMANWSFAGNANYLPASGSVNIDIGQASATIAVNGYSGTYDGDPHGATGTATGINGEDLTGLLNLGPTYVNAGTYTVNWSFAGDANHAPKSGTVEIEIAKANATISVDGYTGVYDGDPHGATGTATGVKGEDLSDLLDLGASFTNVPGGTASWSFAGNANYNPAGGAVEIEIAKANAAIAVNGYSGTYDGDPHGATGSATGVKGEDLSDLLDLGASFTNVPGGTASWSFAGNANYNPAGGAVEIEIAKANAAIAVNGYSGTYDGDPHGATGSATGIKGENLSGLLDLGASFTDVPGGTASWSFAGNANYNPAGGTASISIAKADATVAVVGYTGVYDGDPHGATGSATGIKGEDLSGLLDLGASFTNVPGGTASWSFAGNANYNPASGTASIVITPASQTISFGPLSNRMYGDAPFTVSATGGASGNPVTFTAAGNCTVAGNVVTLTGKGSCTITASQAGSLNYAAAMPVAQSFSIAGWKLRGFYQPVDMGGVLNTVKGGSTVPMKFEIFADTTELTAVSAIKSLAATKISCSSSAAIDDIELTATGGTSLRYDATSGQFIYNWQTPKGAGVCYRVTMTAQDGSTISADFKMK